MNGSCASASTSAARTPTPSWWTARVPSSPPSRSPPRRSRSTASAAAIEGVVGHVDRSRITQAMLGTTHPANAIIQRRGLDRVGILRLAAPGSLLGQAGLRLAGRPARRDHGPHDDRPRRLRVRRPRDRAARPRGDQALRGRVRRAPSRRSPSRAPSRPPTSTTSSGPRRSCARSWAIRSPSRCPTRSARWASWSARTRPRSTPRCCRCPTRSSSGLAKALTDNGLDVTAYLTQNDGTLMGAEQAVKFPILTVGSGPTNSMRGACALAGLQDALVIDVGGTSSDVGILVNGFPRESPTAVEVGGVRTNFRMPDLISIGLGGGTIVRGDGRGREGRPGLGGLPRGHRGARDGRLGAHAVGRVRARAAGSTASATPARVGGMTEATAEAALALGGRADPDAVRPDEGVPPGAAAHRGRRRLAPRRRRTCRASRRSSRRQPLRGRQRVRRGHRGGVGRGGPRLPVRGHEARGLPRGRQAPRHGGGGARRRGPRAGAHHVARRRCP